MNETLRNAIGFFTRETRIMDGLAAACGKGARTARAWDGREIGEKTVYDLASVTKIFTGLALERLTEAGALDPLKRVAWYCPEFRYLDRVTVEQLAAFQVQLRTPERIDARETPEEALRCLREVRVTDRMGPRNYSDIPAMVLKYVIEKAAGMPFYACLKELILDPAGMTETWARVPEDRRGDCLLYGPEYRIEKENWICRRDPERGLPHDPKAAVLQGRTEDLCGHAGLFSTLGDLEKLARAILDRRILPEEGLRKMAVNRTGRQRPDGSYTQYLGYQCYLKHPDQYFSEIPVYMGHAAFGIGGFTGNHFSVDPEGDRFTVFLGNRVRDRLTVVIPEEGKTLEDYGLEADGRGEIRWTDGSVHPSSVKYVHQKDRHLHAAADRALEEEP